MLQKAGKSTTHRVPRVIRAMTIDKCLFYSFLLLFVACFVFWVRRHTIKLDDDGRTLWPSSIVAVVVLVCYVVTLFAVRVPHIETI